MLICVFACGLTKGWNGKPSNVDLLCTCSGQLVYLRAAVRRRDALAYCLSLVLRSEV